MSKSKGRLLKGWFLIIVLIVLISLVIFLLISGNSLRESPFPSGKNNVCSNSDECSELVQQFQDKSAECNSLLTSAQSTYNVCESLRNECESYSCYWVDPI